MKLWHKILLASLALYALAFHAASIYFLSSTHLSNLEQETARAFSDQAIIRERVEAGIQAGGMPEDPGPLMQRYSAYYGSLDIELDLYRVSTGEMFGSLDPGKLDPALLRPASTGSNQTELTTEAQKTSADTTDFVQMAAISTQETDGSRTRMMHVSSQLTGDPDFMLIYTRDINQIYARRTSMVQAFIMIDIISAIVLGLAAYALARRLTRPLVTLGEAAVQIADGHYSLVVPESRDETADLTRAFNKMSEAVRQREQELEQLAEQRQQFIDNLTHEMNTPLTSIQGYASLLQQAKMSEEQKSNAAEVIEREAKRLRELYDRLMTLILARKEALKLETLHLNQVFAEIAQTMMPALREQGIEIKAESAVREVKADHALLLLLLTNLIRNSIAASKAGTTITIGSSRVDDNTVEIFVADQGRGIEPEHIGQIFEPFYRADKSRSRKTGGVGLGLALCREIAARHDGSLKTESNPGQGTVIRFSFPS